MCIGQVGIRMATSEIGGGDTILNARFWEPQGFDEDGIGVWTSNAVQPIEENAK